MSIISFKHFLTEEITGRKVKITPYIGEVGAEGFVKPQTQEERLDVLLQNKSNNPDHQKIHDILNQIDNEVDSDKVPAVHRYGRDEKVNEFHAQLGRIILNGGTTHDVQTMNPNLTIPVINQYLNRLKHHISEKQKGSDDIVNIGRPAAVRLKKENNLPGKMALSVFLSHPHFKDELRNLSNYDFYNKHLQRYMRIPYYDPDSGKASQNLKITLAQARRQHGVVIPVGEQEKRRMSAINRIYAPEIEHSTSSITFGTKYRDVE